MSTVNNNVGFETSMKQLFLVACALLLLALPSAGGEPAGARELTAAEQKSVLAAAEKAIKARELWKGKIVLTHSEVVFDQQPTPPERYVLLRYYRYDGNLVIAATVHVAKATVTDVQTHPHAPASLSPEEYDEAVKIARAHPEVKKALAKYSHLEKIEADALVAQITDPKIPGYQHRVVRLFFRDVQRNYLQVPMVDVDLTTGEVRLDLIRKLHDSK